MAYGVVDPNIESMNPADRNNAAIKAGYTGYDDYLNNRASTQPSGSFNTSGGSFQGTNYEDIIKRSIAMNQEANKPAVASLEASIPETTAKFAQTRSQLQAEVDPLKQRYDNLISQITQRGKVQEQRQSVATSGELAKRGILSSSTLAQQELANALNPITAETSATLKDVSLQGEASQRDLLNQIANLSTQETDAIRNVRNAIAQLQAGGNQQAITNAMNIYKANIDQANKDAETAWKEKVYKEVTLPQAQYELNRPYYKPETGSSGIDIETLAALLGSDTSSKQSGWYDAQGNAWTDTTKTPVGIVQEGQYKGMTMYRDNSGKVTYGNTKWTYK